MHMTRKRPDTGDEKTGSDKVMFWVTLLRGFMVVTLGLVLWIQPQKLRPFLITSMGMFWLVSGVMSIRWGLSGKRTRGLPLLAGIVGVLAGLAALSRRFELLDALVSDERAKMLPVNGRGQASLWVSSNSSWAVC
jgi:uncharacterized membrane protein HdeD (DUF308 family)